MLNKLIIICLALLSNFPGFLCAQPNAGLGQTIQIRTHLNSFVGKPSWLLVIRDVDHGRNIPYIYDFHRGHNSWLALTYSRHYLILASTLYFSPYKNHPYRSKRITNFCGLESNGQIIRGHSMFVTIRGHLSPYADRFSCEVSSFPDDHFTVVLGRDRD